MRVINFLKEHIVVLTIVLLALSLRLVNISDLPPSLNWDEVSHGYNAYSILKTGKDEWGKTLPFIFRAYGDYKLPVYIYLTTIPVFLFGLNPLSVRIVSIIAGTLATLFVYLLIKKLFDAKKLALVTSLLFAISPWNLFLSRVAVEANLALLFIISGIYYLFSGVQGKTRQAVFGAILLGLSVWTYNSARVFVPALLLVFILVYWKKIIEFISSKKQLFMMTLLVLAMFFVPMFYQLINPEGSARYGWVKIIDEGVVGKIIEERNKSQLSPMLTKIIHNRPVYFLKTVITNYFTHFNPEFLFFKGGSHYQFNVPDAGLLYAVSLPFFVIGLIRGFVDMRKSKQVLFAMGWLLVSPLASSLTREAPHALRVIVMLPIPMLLIAVGILTISEYLVSKRKIYSQIFIALVLVSMFLSLEKYFQQYLTEYRTNYSWAWQYGYKEAVLFAKENYDSYDKIIFTKKYGEPHEFVLFYWPWNPESYRNDDRLNRFFQSDWYWVDGFDKFLFINDWQVQEMKLESGGEIDCKESKCLLVTSPGNVPPSWRKLKEINFLDGKSAFEIYANY